MNHTQFKFLIKPIIQFAVQKPLYLLSIPVLFTLWFSYEVFVARPAMTYMGLPQVQSGIAQHGLTRIFRNDGFMLEYSERLANPLWVTYQVSEKKYNPGKRPNFETDIRSFSRIAHSDYTGSGFDRGHMAPNYVIASRYGRNAQHDTFLMTNITPQKAQLNQKSWQRLEEVIANDFSDWHGTFWVVTGPIFSDNPQKIKGTDIAIPEAFYKILIQPTTASSPAKALAFIFPQNAKAKPSLMSFVVSIDEVEKQSGIDFFSQLPDELESTLESQINPQAWRLPEVATRPSRY